MGRLTSLAASALLTLGLGAVTAAAEPDTGHGIDGRESPPISRTTVWMNRSEHVLGAIAAMNEGDTEAVIRSAQIAIGLPLHRVDRLAALNALCVGYVQRGTPGLALDYCDQVVRESRSDWRALNNRGNAQLGLGRADEAIRDYQLAMFRLIGIGDISVRHYGSDEARDGHLTVSANLDLARRQLYQEIQYAAARSMVTLR